MSDINTFTDEVEEFEIHNDLMESDDWEYILGGTLVGTKWDFPNRGDDYIEKVRETAEKHEGQEMTYPEVVLKYSGFRLSVSGFLRRIDPNDIGDVEPRDRVARRIVRLQEEHSWHNIHMKINQSGEQQ